MVLVSYDMYPNRLVHRAHKLPDGTLVWVSGWEAGHLRLGTWDPASTHVLAVLSVSAGEKLREQLNRLTETYRSSTLALAAGFIAQRDTLLWSYGLRTGGTAYGG